MLIEKKEVPQVNDIVVLKLVNGDEIMGKLTNFNATEVELEKVFAVNAGLSPNGSIQIVLMPWLFTASDKSRVSLKREHFFTMIKAEDNAKKSYIENTSNIKIAKNLDNLKV